MVVNYELTGFSSLDDLVAHYVAIDPAGLRVDLGCGFYKPQNFIGIDNFVGERMQIRSQNLPDIIMNLEQPVPLEDECCTEVRASHFLEHSNVPHILDQVHRLLMPQGTFMFTVPYANSAEGMYPGHTIFFTEKWFFLNIQFQECFEIENIRYDPSDTYENEMPSELKSLIPFEIARKFMFNVCNQMTITAKVKKN